MYSKSGAGFVMLFAVTLASLFLAIALGITNIAFNEVKFNTNARGSNDAFFAAVMVSAMYQDWYGVPVLPDANGNAKMLNLYVHRRNYDEVIEIFKGNNLIIYDIAS